MDTLLALFNINTTFFTLLGYPMSYLEFFGTLFTIACVYWATKGKVISWPVGIVGSLLYAVLFFQIQLYSDLLEQVYFIISSFAGWYTWVILKKQQGDVTGGITKNTKKENIAYVGGIVVCTILLSYITMHLHLWLPHYFTIPVSLPILDAFTTVMSFAAQWLLVRKKIENWYLWILVDVIDIGLYWFKGVKFISLEYVLFLVLATLGLVQWMKIMKKEKQA